MPSAAMQVLQQSVFAAWDVVGRKIGGLGAPIDEKLSAKRDMRHGLKQPRFLRDLHMTSGTAGTAGQAMRDIRQRW